MTETKNHLRVVADPDPKDAGAPTENPAMTEEEQQRALIESLFQQGVAFCAQWMPPAALETEEMQRRLGQLVVDELNSQAGLQQLLDDVLDPAARAKYPYVGFYLSRKNADGATVRACDTRVPKALSPGMTLDNRMVIFIASVFGFLTYPPLRALIRASGWDFHFEQASKPLTMPKPADAPKIVTP